MHPCTYCGGWSRHYVTKHFGTVSEVLPYCNPVCEQADLKRRLNNEPPTPVRDDAGNPPWLGVLG
jgi:endogenous inhibitor of DNA gyrase (YacG/DUF329 family)